MSRLIAVSHNILFMRNLIFVSQNLDVTTDSGEKIQCRVLDCDTPTQVKEKILDMIYKNQAYSIRPLASDFHLGTKCDLLHIDRQEL